ncbi:alternative NAD(P)H-ubiquinone oxidoreductase C1, chloroplastic/mitochondrial-like isoform X2 [Primulina huaijiensis]|uniref:alternative NAD(P)H-ubiquinone oxidoreductase C1, chloroplastic/mitochondrial-like isoform X2 n=1 Tax=Primulina huaijiensis TaxID=1492673 RepID=UPI003CC7251D
MLSFCWVTLSVVQGKMPAERGMRKQVVEVDMVLWTVGSKSLLPQLELDDQTYLPLNGRGQAETDKTLRVKGHPRIFAIGDSSAVWNRKGKLLPDTAQADFAGWNIWAAINTVLFCLFKLILN